MNLFHVFLLSLLLLCVGGVKWKSCDPGPTAVTSLHVSGCEQNSTCPLIKGHTASIDITFVSDRNITAAEMKVYGVIHHVSIPFPLDNPHACSHSGIKCPIRKGLSYTYRSKIFVKESYPSLRLLIKWRLEDQTGGQEFCILFPAILTPTNPHALTWS